MSKIKKTYLIYNSQCDFCTNTARYFNKKLRGRLDILSNRTKKSKTLVPKRMVENLKKDVHLVVDREVYSRGEACHYLAQMLHPSLALLGPFGILLFEIGYVILKKIKKYL